MQGGALEGVAPDALGILIMFVLLCGFIAFVRWLARGAQSSTTNRSSQSDNRGRLPSPILIIAAIIVVVVLPFACVIVFIVTQGAR